MKLSGDRLIGKIKPPRERKRKRGYPVGQCGKKVYSTNNAARKVKNYTRKRNHVPLRTYYCEVCGGWHLTKQVSI